MKPLQLDLAVPVTALVLIGGGEFSFGETREIDEALLRMLPNGRKAIAFLPTASGSSEYAQHLGAYLTAIDSAVTVRNVPIYRGRDGRRQKNAEMLRSADLIYIGGGVTNALLAMLHESPAEAAMREAAANGTVVAAIGASASSFGAHVRDMRGVTSSIPGLGWLRRTVIESGFEERSDEALRRLMSIPDVALGIGIPAKTALVIRGDGSTALIGSGSIVTYRKQ